MREQITRRRVITGIAAVTAGSTVLATSTENTKAQVQLGSLDVPDVSKKTTGTINDIALAINASWSYESNLAPDEYIVDVRVGPTKSDLQTLTGVRVTDPGTSVSDSRTFEGSLFDAGFQASQFAAEAGETIQKEIAIQLRLRLFNGGSVAVEKEVTDTAVLSITNETITAELSLGGSGSITVS